MISEPAPSRPPVWRLLTAMDGPGKRWPGALRSAIALFLPGALVLTWGYSWELALVAGGAFAVMYGEGHPYRVRWRVILIAGACLVSGTVMGALVGSVVHAEGGHAWLGLSACYIGLIAVLGAFLQNALTLPPPGAFMIVMVSGGATMVARMGINPIVAGSLCALGVLFSLLVGMSGWLLHPHRPEEQAVETLDKALARPLETVADIHRAKNALYTAWCALADAGITRGGAVVKPQREELVRRVQRAAVQLATLREENTRLTDAQTDLDTNRTAIPLARPSARYRIYRALHRYSHATVTATRVAIASTVAATVSLCLGLDRPDWAVVSALLVLQWGPERVRGTVRGCHRLLGSLLGIALFAGIHTLAPSGWAILGLLTACQYLAEIWVVRNYAVGVIITTPLALMMGGALTQPLGEAVVARSAEVLIAVAAALIMLWTPAFTRKDHAHVVNRCIRAMGTLLGTLLTARPAQAFTARRDLQYELLRERRTALALAEETPHPQAWERHLLLQRTGYQLLDYCTSAQNRELSPEEVTRLAGSVRHARDAYAAAGSSPT